MLRLFKWSNGSIETLMTVYNTIIRPVLEYASLVWHFSIPSDYLCDEIEVLPKSTLRIIMPALSYVELWITGENVNFEGTQGQSC